MSWDAPPAEELVYRIVDRESIHVRRNVEAGPVETRLPRVDRGGHAPLNHERVGIH